MNHWKIIRKISLAYLAVIFLAVVSMLFISAFTEHGSKPASYVGCHSYDAMLIGYKCIGFTGSKIIGFFINLPLNALYSLLFVFTGLKVALMAIALWALPVLFVISSIKVKNA